MAVIGYARVSTREGQQVFDRQVDALRAAGCERVYDDRGSGATADRPGLKACLHYLQKDDVLVVLDLDRLGRRAGELIRLVDELESRGVGFRALNTAFDTTTPAGRAFLQIQAAFAEMERNLIRQRIAEADRERSIRAMCLELGNLPASTLYHYLHADGSLKAPGRALLGTDGRARGARLGRGAPRDMTLTETRRARPIA